MPVNQWIDTAAKLPPLLLDDDEAVAVALSLSTQESETADRALRKLEQVLPSRMRHRVNALQEYTVGTAAELEPQVTVQIVNACRAHERLRFDYVKFDGEQDRREVEPYRLVHLRGRWYLVGWDVGRQDWRTWRRGWRRRRGGSGRR